MSFIIRLVVAAFWIVVIAVLLYLLVALALRGIRFIAERVGFEFSDFGKWLRSVLPKRKRKRIKKEERIE